MSKLEVLCATMHQTDFSKIKEMNLTTDVIFANQADCYNFSELEFHGHYAKMITTTTRGVGNNRNIALLHASAEYCLLADDDVVYDDDMEKRVIAEFETHPDADVIFFHFESDDSSRSLTKYKHTRKWLRFNNLPFGGIRIAFKLNAVRKANVWFSTLFGGGCIFPSGEDSLFLTELRRAGLVFYVSKETIGKVSFETSTWYTGVDQKYFYGKGAFYQAARPKTKYFWILYMALKFRKNHALKLKEKIKWMRLGVKGYQLLLSFEQFCKKNEYFYN